MKNIFMLFVLSLVFVSTNAYCEKSDGYRMGMITDAAVSGWVNKTVEGSLSMGVNGQPMVLIDKTTDSKGNSDVSKNVINPWKFSSKDLNSKLLEYQGHYVYVHYTKVLVQLPGAADTKYNVDSVVMVDKSKLEPKFIESEGYSVSKSNGALIGRVVQVSKTGVLAKTYEATIQVGNGGGQYKFMTIKDEKLYNYCIESLKRALMVKIYYENLGVFSTGSFSNTSYRIIKVEQINSELNSGKYSEMNDE